jgi:tetratricopeptide (TPR) repeat protein
MRRVNLPIPVIVLTLLILFLDSCGPGKERGKMSTADSLQAVLAKLSEEIADSPDDANLYYNRAQFYIGDQSFDRALTDIRKAIALNDRNPAFYITLSDIYLFTGQPQLCGEALNKANALEPQNNAVLNKLAKFSLIMKDYPKTYEYVEQALAVKKINPPAYFTRANALLEQGDTIHALGDLMIAVDQDQKYFEAYALLGDLYAMKNDPMAPAYYNNALNVRPASKETLYKLGMYYQENGQFEKAIRQYTLIMQVDSTFRNAPYNIGYIYLVYLNDFPKAAEFFSRAIGIDDQYYEAWYNRGYANELMGKTEDAYRDYRQTLKIQVNYPKAVDALNRLDAAKSPK